jgi:hypothetical protein
MAEAIDAGNATGAICHASTRKIALFIATQMKFDFTGVGSCLNDTGDAGGNDANGSSA